MSLLWSLTLSPQTCLHIITWIISWIWIYSNCKCVSSYWFYVHKNIKSWRQGPRYIECDIISYWYHCVYIDGRTTLSGHPNRWYSPLWNHPKSIPAQSNAPPRIIETVEWDHFVTFTASHIHIPGCIWDRISNIRFQSNSTIKLSGYTTRKPTHWQYDDIYL